MAVLVFFLLLILLSLAAWRWGVDSRDQSFSVGAMIRPHRRR